MILIERINTHRGLEDIRLEARLFSVPSNVII